MKQLEISDETYEKIKNKLIETEKKEIIMKQLEISDETYEKIKDQLMETEKMDTITKGILNEVEPIKNNDWYVNMSTVTDFCLWKHPLPKEQK